MEFRILGPLEVRDRGQAIELAGARQRALLTLLLLHPNQPLPADRLIEDLWRGKPPREAMKSLQMQIGRLRRALGEGRDVLETVSGGYKLKVGPDALDLSRFERGSERGRRLAADGRFADAAREFATALEEWRGGALDDVAYEPFAQAEIGRLEELRLATFEEYVDAELALGRHAEWIGRLQAVAAEHPFRERLTSQVILALYRAGRQADALEAYSRARTRLSEELGLEPSRNLHDLQAAVLAHDPALDWVAPEPDAKPVARALPRQLRDEDSFVGRQAECRRLADAWDAINAGSRRLTLIAGEAGIGKTRLATRMAARAQVDGANVLYGRCDEHLAVPYRPWIDLLTQFVDGASDALLEAHVATFGGPLARLTPALARRVKRLPPPQATHPEIEEYLLFEAVSGALLAAGEEQPLLLFLDDLHWADKPTLSLLCHVVSRGEGLRALLICTFRDSEISEDLAATLAALQREPGVDRIAVSGLEPEDVVALLRVGAGRELSEAGVAFAHGLAHDTSGNPFFLGEMLNHHAESGTLQYETSGWRLAREHRRLAVPDGVRDVIGQRVHRLGDTAADLLRTAAVIGVEFDLYLLAAVLERAPEELLDPLDVARRARLVREDDEVPGRYRFEHALVGHALRLELGPTRLALRHERVARLLDERPDTPPSELAYHWSGAGLHGEAIRASRRAGHYALEALAPDEAVRWFTEALRLHRGQTYQDRGLECDLLTDLGEAQRRAGDGAYRETLLEASGLARSLSDGDRLASAVLANFRGFEIASGGVDSGRVGELESALALLGDADPLRRARLLSLLTFELTFVAPIEERRRLSDEAVALGRADPQAYASALWARHTVLWTPELLDEHRVNAAELRRVAARLEDPLVSFCASCDTVLTSVWSADLPSVDAALAEMAAITARVGKRHRILPWVLTWYSVWRAHLAGRLDEAERLAHDAAELASTEPDANTILADQLAAIRWDQGRLAELVPNLENAVSRQSGLLLFEAWLSLAVVDAGRPDEGRARVASAFESGFTGVRRDIMWLSTLCLYAETSAQTGMQEAGAALYALIEPFADQVVFNASIALGSAHWFLSRLAASLGERERAAGHMEAATAIHRRLDAPLPLARGAGAEILAT